MRIDLNCDMGEGMPNDETLMPVISSANIACGKHAGSREIMLRTMENCMRYKVKIGAHPGFADRENFGRKEMLLEGNALYDLLSEQLELAADVSKELGTHLHHVKAHGALYNMAAKIPAYAEIIARAVKELDETLVIYGLSGSHMVSRARSMGMLAWNEAFADRRYLPDGSLAPRGTPGAVMETVESAIEQARRLIHSGEAETVQGGAVPVLCDTICIHGDHPLAMHIAEGIRNL